MTDIERLTELRRLRRERLASAVVRRNVAWAVSSSLIPLPIVNSSAIVAIQVKMLAELSGVYGVPFDAHSGRAVIASLVCSLSGGAIGQSILGTSIFTVIARGFPVLGFGLGALTLPSINGAITYGLGKVCQQHFAHGGTILNFDFSANEQRFRREFAAGRKATRDITPKTTQEDHPNLLVDQA